MLVNIETNGNRCNFEFCRHYLDGECQDEKARKECEDIAYAVLCIDVENEDERNDSKDE